MNRALVSNGAAISSDPCVPLMTVRNSPRDPVTEADGRNAYVMRRTSMAAWYRACTGATGCTATALDWKMRTTSFDVLHGADDATLAESSVVGGGPPNWYWYTCRNAVPVVVVSMYAYPE